VYVAPTDWYLSIDPKPGDVIETPYRRIDVMDWDIRKALSLLRSPTRLCWIGYISDYSLYVSYIAYRLRALAS